MKSLILSGFRPYSHLSNVIRVVLYVLVASLLGWQLGRAITSPSSDLIVSLIFTGACILITLKYPLEGLLLALILQPFVPFAYLYIKPGDIPAITLGRMAVAIIFALILARGATGRRIFPPLTWIDVLMVLTIIALSAAAVRSNSVRSSLQWVFDMYAIPYVIYYIAKNLVTDRSRLTRVLWTLAIIGAYCGIYGIYTQTTGHILFIDPKDLTGPLWYSKSLRIMRGLLDSPHVFGLVFSLAIPVDFYLLIKARTLNRKILSTLALAVTVGGLFFTYKRTAWVAAMASVLALQFFFPRFRRLFLVLVVVVTSTLVLYSNEISDSVVATERVNDNTNTLNGRLELWDAALKAWKQEALFGYGFGQYLARSSFRVIESNYIWILVDAGLAGFLPFVLIFIFLLIASIRVYRARAPAIFVERDLVAVFWGSFMAYLVSLSTVVMNHEFPPALFFLLAGAIIGSQQAILDQQPRDRTAEYAEAAVHIVPEQNK